MPRRSTIKTNPLDTTTTAPVSTEDIAPADDGYSRWRLYGGFAGAAQAALRATYDFQNANLNASRRFLEAAASNQLDALGRYAEALQQAQQAVLDDVRRANPL
jgi:hypothetical protein